MDVVSTLPRWVRGLSLIELITTTAVLGISLAVIIPSWSGFAQRSQITTAANQMLTHLRYARSTAVHHGEFVSLCPSTDGEACSGDTRGWHRGYLVFRDPDGNRSRTLDEPLLRVQGPSAPGLKLFSTSGRPAIRFRADGAAWSTNTTFSICAGEDIKANRAVVLYGSGRARVDRRTPSGHSVSCS